MTITDGQPAHILQVDSADYQLQSDTKGKLLVDPLPICTTDDMYEVETLVGLNLSARGQMSSESARITADNLRDMFREEGTYFMAIDYEEEGSISNLLTFEIQTDEDGASKFTILIDRNNDVLDSISDQYGIDTEDGYPIQDGGALDIVLSSSLAIALEYGEIKVVRFEKSDGTVIRNINGTVSLAGCQEP